MSASSLVNTNDLTLRKTVLRRKGIFHIRNFGLEKYLKRTVENMVQQNHNFTKDFLLKTCMIKCTTVQHFGNVEHRNLEEALNKIKLKD